MRTLITLGALMGLLLPAEAGDKKEKSPVPVKGTAENGPDVKKDVALLTTAISWKTTIDEAEKAARKEGRMVFWMHMLGDLNGAT